MAAGLERERAEQSRWRVRSGMADAAAFEQLLRTEFLPAAAHRERQEAMLRRLVSHAAAKVPHYRDWFRRHGVEPGDIRGIADLARLPLLTRQDIQERGQALLMDGAEALKPMLRPSRTSGSTGSPIVVQRPPHTWTLFAMLKQRELRWFRFDPAGSLASIRGAADLPGLVPGEPLKKGETVRAPAWPLVGGWFRTGAFAGFGNQNAMDEQAEFLRREDPDHLLMQSAELEHLALAFQDGPPPQRLQACLAISQQMTAEMRHRIERILGVPVHENYGLNEVSLVASRCPEGELFHVHVENCIVEVVDEEGRPCRPGDQGRILVTALTNEVMPLIRYDADDLAVAVDEPCACGRTLPAFTGLLGRYRRNALLPPGTWWYWVMFQYALEKMPPELMQPLRQYQLHQFRDNRFELRLMVSSPLSEAFKARIREYWRRGCEGEPAPLEIVEVASIPRPAGGKFQSFTSDFAPPPGADPGPSARA